MKPFDDRETCFHTGKKISPPMIDRKLCACCGLRIVKGYIVEIGHVGEDCAALIQRRKSDKAMFGSSVDEFVNKYKKQTGWDIKPAVRKTLETDYA